MLITSRSRIAGIVTELGGLLTDRQALVHQLETLPTQESGSDAPERAELSDRLGQLIARQALLLDELVAIRPPAGRTST